MVIFACINKNSKLPYRNKYDFAEIVICLINIKILKVQSQIFRSFLHSINKCTGFSTSSV